MKVARERGSTGLVPPALIKRRTVCSHLLLQIKKKNAVYQFISQEIIIYNIKNKQNHPTQTAGKINLRFRCL